MLLLALVHGLLTVDTLLKKGITLDETAHLPAGLSYLEKGTFRMFPLNGPLGRLLPALLARHVPHHAEGLYESTAWRSDPPLHWHFGLLFQDLNSRSRKDAAFYLELFTYGRLATALLSVAAVPLLFAWGRWWFGMGAGLAAAALWALCPNVIAHAGLTTTDLAAAVTGLLAAYTFARLLDAPGPVLALLAGIALGLAQITKYSALGLGVVFALWAAFETWRRRSAATPAPGAGRVVLLAAILGGTALATIGAGYGFEGMGDRLGTYPFRSRALTRETAGGGRTNRFAGTALGAVPVPLPRPYVLGFDALKFEDDAGYQMYLDGTLRRTAWARYYVEAALWKLPLGTLLLAALGAVALLPPERRARAVPLLVLTAVPLAMISLLTNINLGFRYVLPLLPFVFLSAGGTFATGTSRRLRVAGGLALLWNAGSALRIHPDELAHFNELAGGPAGGRLRLIDSNLDWGQDLRPLASWLDRHPDWKRDVRLAYAGMVAPEIEGISPYRLAPRDLRYVAPARRLPWERPEDLFSWGPQPGKFAVSVNFERGMFLGSPCPRDLAPAARRLTPGAFYPDTGLLSSPGGAYAYFQELRPRIEPEIGYSILLYDVSRAEAQSARKRLGIPPLP